MDDVPFVQNGLAFFVGLTNNVSSTDLEPWVTDGTPAGTMQLLDTNPGYSYPASFTDFHGITLFETNAYQTGRRLWRTNGTAAGTRSVGDFTLGAERVAANQRMFYVASDAAAGIELFAIDNERPTASDDMLGAVQAGQSIGADVLANDSDSDGELDVGGVAIVTAPAGGSVNIGADGQISYLARAGFSGVDSFTYLVTDDQGYASNAATVRVTVTAAPALPVDPPPSTGGGGGSGGGGGAMPFLDLFLLSLLAAVSRRSRALKFPLSPPLGVQ
jgi:ELWxxDGT repeat protein